MGNVDTSILGVFDPPRALKPSTAMMAPAPTETAGPPVPSIAQPASQAVPSQPEKTASPSTAHIGNDPSSNVNVNSHPPVWAGSTSPGGIFESSSEAPPTQTSKTQYPQQVGGSNPTVPAPINAPNADSPAANVPIAHALPIMNLRPRCLLQALAPAPAASPQPYSQANATPQQGSGSPAKLPTSANSPALDGGAQPAVPDANRDQAAKPPSSGLASKVSPTNGGSQPANDGTQSASGDPLPASGNPRNGASRLTSGVSPPIVTPQNQGLSPPSNKVASSGSS